MWINQGKSLKRGIENDQNVKYVNIDLEKEQEENLEKLNIKRSTKKRRSK